MKRHKRLSRANKLQRRQRLLRGELLEPRLPLAVDTWEIDLSANGPVDLFGTNAGGEVQQMYEDNPNSDGSVISTSNVPGQNNQAPIAIDDAVSTDQNTVHNGDVLVANPTTADSDPDGDPISVTQVEGAAANLGVVTTLGSGATVNVAAAGTFAYDPNGAFDSLAAGAMTTDTFAYTIEDSFGASDTATVTVTVTGLNDVPTATNLTQTQGYVEDAASVPLDDMVITDPDVGDTITATLTLANTAAGVLTAGSGNGETYTPGTGIWTVTGTLAAVNAALAAVAFTPATNNDVDTTVTTHVEDQGAVGPVDGVITLDVTPVNDAPTATNLTQTKPYTEGDATVALDDIVVSDVDTDPAQTITATLTLANTAAGVLTAGSGNGETYTPGTGIWTVTGTLTAVNAALAAVAFTPATNNDVDTTVTTHVEDQGAVGPVDGVITLDVTPVNDAPTATNLTQTKPYTEGDATVALDDIVVSDVDTDPAQTITATLTLANTAAGVLTAGSGNGETYTPGTGIWTVTGTLTAVNAALAAVAFTPATNNDVDTTVTTHVEDQGAVGPVDGVITLDVTPVNDAPTATNLTQTKPYTEGDATVALDDIVVSDVDTDPAQTITATLTLANTAAGVLTAGSGNGETYTAGTGIWTVTGTLTAVNAALAAVAFTPATNNDVDTTVTTHVEDQGAVGPADGAITLDVTPVNDAPVVDLDPNNSGGNQPNFDAGTFIVAVGTPVLLTDTDASISDVDTGAMITSLTATITAGLADGASEVLGATNSGGADTVVVGVNVVTITASGGQASLSDFQTVLRSITYDNTAGTPTDGARTISIVANDGTANSTTVTSTIDVVSSPTLDLDGNDSSTATGNDFLGAFTEDGGAVAAADTDVVIVSPLPNLDKATATLTNRPDGVLEVLAATASGGIVAGDITYTPATGVLLIDPVVAQPVADFQAVLASLTYNNSDQDPDTTTRLITVTVTDTSAATSATATSTITVAAVNDPPTDGDENYPVQSNVAITINAAGGLLANASDPEGNTPITLIGTSIGTYPTTAGGSITTAADGSFTYTPQTGDAGVADTFVYTVEDSTGLDATSTSTATFNVNSNTIWFVDNTGGNDGTGDGSLSAPFKTLVPLDDSGANSDTINQNIFVYNQTANALTDDFDLEAGQRLIGEGVQGAGGDTINDFLGFTAPTGSQTLPPINAATNPAITTSGTDAITLNSGNTIRGIDIGNTGAGHGIFGNGFGTLTIDDVNVSGTGPIMDLATGTISDPTGGDATFTNLISTSNTGDGIRMVTVGGSFTVDNNTTVSGGTQGINIGSAPASASYDFGTTSISGVSNEGIAILTSNSAATFTFDSLSVTSAGTSLRANSAGTINIAGTGNTLTSSAGSGVDIISTTLGGGGVTFSSVSSTNTSGDGINLDTVTGNFTANGGTITNTGGIGIDINAGSGNFTFAGTLDNNGGRSVEVTNAMGGTKTFSGAIDDDGTGINLTSNSGATITFSGGIALDTTSNVGFTATGGGTVNVADTAVVNTISTTTATALNVASTTIGATGLNFRSISAGTGAAGPANGIILNTTGSSGGLTVTGVGTTAASGGTIQDTTSHAILLTNTRDVDLSNMNLDDVAHHGIFGTTVTNFDLDNANISDTGNSNDERAIQFNNLLGTATITNTDILNPADHYIFVDNTSGTLTSLTITGSTFNDGAAEGTNGGSAIRIDARNSAVITSIQIGVRNDGSPCLQASGSCDVTIDSPHGLGIDIRAGLATGNVPGTITDADIDNVRILAGNAGGVLLASDGTGNLTAALRNSFVQSDNSVAVGAGVDGNASGTFSILDNTTRVINTGFLGVVNTAVRADGNVASDSPTLEATIEDNDIQGGDAFGIEVSSRGSAGSADVALIDNTIANVGDDGIRARAGNGSAGETDTLNLFLSGNTATTGIGSQGFDLRDQSASTTFNIGCDNNGALMAACNALIGTSAATDQGVLALHGNTGTSIFVGITPPPVFTIIDSDAINNPLLAAAGATGGATPAAPLTEAELQPIVAAAIARWTATGLAQWQLERLDDATFAVGQLGGAELGSAFIERVTIDADAAGHGWFVDPTPTDDAEFSANADGQAAGRMDLLTVVMHEVGHLLGQDHAGGSSLMAEDLPTGTRRFIAGGELQITSVRDDFAELTSDVTEVNDVNGDGVVSPMDALKIVNRLNAGELDSASLSPDLKPLDTNGDGFITELDVLSIFDHLNQITASAQEQEAERESPVVLTPAAEPDDADDFFATLGESFEAQGPRRQEVSGDSVFDLEEDLLEALAADLYL